MNRHPDTGALCTICGDDEPFHVHNEGKRIEDYFTVGRGQTDFGAAEAWKHRVLTAVAIFLASEAAERALAKALATFWEDGESDFTSDARGLLAAMRAEASET